MVVQPLHYSIVMTRSVEVAKWSWALTTDSIAVTLSNYT